MSKKHRRAPVEITTEAKVTAPDLDVDVTTTRGERRQGIGLQCECGAQMLVERTRWPGRTYPDWLRTPYRLWRCPKCRRSTRQDIKKGLEQSND